jgi:hypothetical protein
VEQLRPSSVIETEVPLATTTPLRDCDPTVYKSPSDGVDGGVEVVVLTTR